MAYPLNSYVLLKSVKCASYGGKVRLRHVSIADNIADLLKKPLPFKTFKHMRGMVLGHGLVNDFALRGET